MLVDWHGAERPLDRAIAAAAECVFHRLRRGGPDAAGERFLSTERNVEFWERAETLAGWVADARFPRAAPRPRLYIGPPGDAADRLRWTDRRPLAGGAVMYRGGPAAATEGRPPAG